jgi:hypothetical protein
MFTSPAALAAESRIREKKSAGGDFFTKGRGAGQRPADALLESSP